MSETKIPDLNPLIKASEAVADILKKGATVVYESTVYLGLRISAYYIRKGIRLQYNTGLFVGYSPERINPGDKEHTITKIQKVVSGSTPQCLKPWQRSRLHHRGRHIRSSIIKTAEAAKVIENTQRDINIAFVNELARSLEK